MEGESKCNVFHVTISLAFVDAYTFAKHNMICVVKRYGDSYNAWNIT